MDTSYNLQGVSTDIANGAESVGPFFDAHIVRSFIRFAVERRARSDLRFLALVAELNTMTRELMMPPTTSLRDFDNLCRTRSLQGSEGTCGMCYP